MGKSTASKPIDKYLNSLKPIFHPRQYRIIASSISTHFMTSCQKYDYTQPMEIML